MSSRRRVASLVALIAAATLGLDPLGAAYVAAAEPGLELVTATRYELLPDEGRVHVTIDAAATSLTPDTEIERTFHSGLTLVVQPEAANLTASSGGFPIPTSVVDEAFHGTSVEVTFGRGIFFQELYQFRVEFDLLDPGDLPARDIRITRGLALFPVWAFGTEGTAGSTVEVVVPTGYAASVPFGESLDEAPGTDGGTVLRATAIPDPTSFVAYVIAERAGAYVETDLTVSIGSAQAQFHLAAWEDDPDWADLMRTVLTDGVPAMADAIGLPYPVAAAITVREGTFSRLGDYAGFYDSQRRLIMVRYDGDAFVGLHEAAHLWFNGTLLDGRWIDEGFASFYAEEAGRRAGIAVDAFELSPLLESQAFPLNDWGEPGSDPPLTEEYAYAASNEVARRIADLAGVDGLQLVWRAARDDEFAYQPLDPPGPERGEARTSEGWQRLLDLLEERTSADFDPIWVEWIVTDDEAALLDEREEARAQYVETLADADGWNLPRSIRLLMGGWQFEEARERLEVAESLLAERERITERAAALDLTPPEDLRRAFEGGASLGAAAAEAREELAALDTLAAGEATLAGEPSALAAVGLLGLDPQARMADARDAFEAGDLEQASADAEAAGAAWQGAEEAGRERVVVVGAWLLAADALLVAAAVLRQRRLRARVAPVRP